MNLEAEPIPHQGLSPNDLSVNQQPSDTTKENEYINEKFTQLLKKIDLQKKN